MNSSAWPTGPMTEWGLHPFLQQNRTFRNKKGNVSIFHSFNQSFVHKKYILSHYEAEKCQDPCKPLGRDEGSSCLLGTPAGKGVQWSRWPLPTDLGQHLHLLFLLLILLLLLPFWKKPETAPKFPLEFCLHLFPSPYLFGDRAD